MLCLPSRLLKTTSLTDFQKPYNLLAVSAKSCYNGSQLTVAYLEMKMHIDWLKMGAAKEQEDNWVTYEEMKSHIKSLHKPPKQTDNYYLLSRHEQVIIF